MSRRALITREQPTEQDGTGGTVLVVDDQPADLELLFHSLEQSGFRVLVATSGEEALEQLQHALPDVILLDIVLPGMSGFDVCAGLKVDPRTCSIPVIFMSGLDDTENKVHGFAVGAVDYVIKPLNQDEVLARVSAQAAVRRLRHKLQERNRQLEERTHELAERNEELDAFNRMVAHDLRGSLTRIGSHVELLLSEGALEQRVTVELEHIRESTESMAEIIDSLLLLASIPQQRIQRSPVRMAAIIERVLRQLDRHIAERQAAIQAQTDWPVVMGYAPWIERVWFNYLSNALKYGGEPPYLELGADAGAGPMIRFWVRDNGAGIEDDARHSIFKPFTRYHSGGIEGHGIGLSIVQRIITKLGGDVGVCSLPDGGSEFYFTLPRV